MNHIRRPSLAVLGAGVACTVLSCNAASIQSLGDFPDGYWSRAFALSADGSTVAGSSYWFDGTRHAFRWTRTGGLVDLGSIADSPDNAAMTLSADGSIAAGYSGTEGYRWTLEGGFENLGHLGANLLATPLASSATGNAIVGYDGSTPFRWTPATGMSALATLPGATTGAASAITPSGSFIAGNLGLQLVRWNGSVPTAIADFPSDLYVAASAINSEGNVIAGRVLHAGANSTDALCWIEGFGARFLPDLPGGDDNASVQGVTSDGLTGVGFGSEIPFWTTATIWSAAHGLQRLADVLTAQGVDLSNWDSLDEAYAISPDGRFIAGSGTVAATFRQEAFIAEITPLPAPPQSPWTAVAPSLPGRVQAEHYDTGGQLVAFFDTTAANAGAALRSDAVDLVSNRESAGGLSAKMSSREWLEYTVNVTTPGPLVLRLRVAAAAAGSSIKVLTGPAGAALVPVVHSLAVPNTGSANTYTIVETDISLPIGTQILRLCANGTDFCVNWFEVAPRGTYREIWTGASGNRTSQIPLTRTPNQTGFLPALETPANSGDNYGIRLRSYLRAPSTGTYRFWIASDNDSDLLVSTSSNPASRRRIASVSGNTNPRQWSKYNSQKSAAISLVAGQLYYVEVLQKEGTGGDHVSVGWSKPGQSTQAPSEVIPTSALSAFLP